MRKAILFDWGSDSFSETKQLEGFNKSGRFPVNISPQDLPKEHEFIKQTACFFRCKQ